MSKITLDQILSGYDLSKVNANFQAIEEELNGKVLYRDNPVGETNSLVTDIDADGKRIYNLPSPVEDGEPVTKGYLLGGFSNDLDSFAVRAENAAAASEQSATASAASASAAAGSAVDAANTLDAIEQIYLGDFAIDPVTDNDAGPLSDGMLYFNNTTFRLRVYSGGIWRDGVEVDVVAFANDVFTGDGVDTTFTLSATPTSASSVFVFIGGVYQRPTTDYTVSGDVVTFTTAPFNGALIVCNTANSIATNFLANNSVTTLQLQDGSVTTPKLADNAVSTVKVVDAAITEAKLASDSVTNLKLANDSVTQLKIADLAISTSKLQDSSVGSSAIAADAISTSKILNAAVTEAKLATDAVATTKIAALAVTEAKLAANAVSTAKIANLAVTTAKLADASVTAAKLASDAIELVSGGARGIQVYDVAGSYTFTVPVGVTKVKAIVIGGAGGEGATYPDINAGAGGKGGIGIGWVSVSGSVIVTVGAGGAGASISGDTGGTGGNSSFGLITANGGTGGRGAFTGAAAGTNSGATGGTYNLDYDTKPALWDFFNPSTIGTGRAGATFPSNGFSGNPGAVILEW